MPEGYEGVDLGGAAGGEVAGGDGDEEEDCGYGSEGERVVGGDAEELIGHEAGEGERGDEAEDDAEESHFCALAEDELEDVAGLRAQGDADADFVGALADEIGNHTVNSHTGQEQRQRGEDAEQNHGNAARGEGVGDDIIHGHYVVDDFPGIDFRDGAADGVHNGGGIALGAQNDGDGISDEGHEFFGELHERKVHLGLNDGGGFGFKTPLLDVAADADDFGFHAEGGEMKMFADGIFAGEVGAREEVINDDDDGGALVILRREIAAAAEGDVHSGLETGFGEIEERLRHVLLRGGFGLAFDPEALGGHVNHRAGAEGDGDGLHAGNGLHFGVELAEAGARFCGSGVRVGGERENEGDGVVRSEARVDTPKSGEAADHEAGADEKNESEGDFRDDKDLLDAMTHAAAAAAGFFEDFLQVGARAFEGGDEAENDSGEKRSGESEEENAGVDGDFVGAGKRFRQSGDDGFGAPDSKEQAEGAADASEEQAFGEELAENAKAAGAEGKADGKFAGAGHGAGEEKISDVGAGDEEKKADRGEKHDKEGLDIADDVFFERNERDAFVLVDVGVFLGEVLRDGIHIGLGLRDGNAGFKATDGVSAKVDAAIAEGDIGPLAAEGVDIAALAVKGKAGRDDADDGVVRTVEAERFAGNVERSAEFAAPETAAEHDNGSGAELIVGLIEKAADDGMDAEDFEEFVGDHVAGEAFGDFAAAEEVVVLVAVHGERGEGLVVALPVEKVGVVDGSAFDAGDRVVEGDELAGLWVGERIEENAVDNGEEGGVGANAESQSENGDGGEERRLAERAKSVTKVLQESDNGAPPKGRRRPGRK
jgi:hypothetical protein